MKFAPGDSQKVIQRPGRLEALAWWILILYCPDMAQHYYTVTWDQLHRDAKALAWRLMRSAPGRASSPSPAAGWNFRGDHRP